MDRRYNYRFNFFHYHHSDEPAYLTKIDLFYMKFLWKPLIEVKLI